MIVRAIVTTNSVDDKYARVSVKCEGIWDNSPLTHSIGGIPLKKGDYVFVDVTVPENPIILGRSMGGVNSWERNVNGSVIWESSDGTNWSIAFVKNDCLEIYNSKSASIKVDGKDITINANSITVTGDLKHSGQFNVTGVVGVGLVAGTEQLPVTGTLSLTGASYTLTK